MNLDSKCRSLFRNMVCIGCIAFMTAVVQSEELTVRSGSRTITIRPGKSDNGSRTMAVDDLIQEMLDAHNDIRSKVEIPPLQWSRELAAYSQKWANSLIANNRIAHNSKSPYGENIFATGLGSTPSSVVTEWASESQNYAYITNSCKGECGHYTQLIWGNTRKVGCAVAHNDLREVWVCSYDPPGNFQGEWPY